MTAVRRGDYGTAWEINDAVLGAGGFVPDDPRLPYHMRAVWDGRDFAGRDVLVRCYHGLGDTLQFARYLPILARRVASLALEAPPALVPLLRGVAGVDRLIAFDVTAPAPPSACDFEIMEVWQALRRPPEEVPPLALPVQPEHPPGDGLLIGVCCETGGWGADRTVPLADLARAISLPSVRLLRLQRGRGEAVRWINRDDPLDDMRATAARVAACDLVVTVDTMIAHLAGALGRPVWLLLHHVADWRWMDARHDSPWYPTMRLYRQAQPGGWHEPLAMVGRDLAALVAIGHPEPFTGQELSQFTVR